jgi:hypothetical protein
MKAGSGIPAKIKQIHMKYLMAVGVLVLLISACRSTKKISTAMSKKDSTTVTINPAENDSAKKVDTALDKIKKSHIDFNTFSAQMKIDYSDSRDKKYDVNAFLRMKKDSVIWISINAILGIEAFRVKITRDTVSVLDKINKTIQYHSFDYLREMTNLPVDFSILQDLIIGNPVFLDSNIVAYTENENFTSLTALGSFFKNFATFYNPDLLLQRSKLDDVDLTRSRTADLTYQDYENSGNYRFSTKRKISIAYKTKLDIDLEFKKVEFGASQNYPFSVPPKYKLK